MDELRKYLNETLGLKIEYGEWLPDANLPLFLSRSASYARCVFEGIAFVAAKMENEDGVPPRGCIINPVLTLGKISTADPDPYEEEEGCLSFPGYGFPLKRAEWVTVNGLDEHGNPVRFEATGWFARCMQHETDHLDGKLYVNRLNKKWTSKMKKVVKKEGWTVDGNSWMPGVDPDPFGH